MCIKRILPFAMAGMALALSISAAGARSSGAQAPASGTGNEVKAETVPQTGGTADQLRHMLGSISLPPGFHIALYAVVPGARQLAVGPTGKTVFVGTRQGRVWALAGANSHANGREVRQFAPSLKFNLPNGVCFSKDGTLYTVEHNRVLAFPDAESTHGEAAPAARVIVPQGQLIPPADESRSHGARTCVAGPDGRLYITLGNPYNVPPREKLASYAKSGVMGIVSMDMDGQAREVYARGIRNSVGLDINPADGTLWFTDNQVDGMGDDQPPGELNRALRAGQDFGFPYYGGGKVRTEAYQDDALPPGLVFPEVEMDAHAADLGMAFYTGSMFPQRYRGGIFSAQHGSWNRTIPVGARIMFTSLKADGTAGSTQVFAQGWLTQDHRYLGRPVDIAMLPDGSLLVSDDKAGAVYRIWHGD